MLHPLCGRLTSLVSSPFRLNPLRRFRLASCARHLAQAMSGPDPEGAVRDLVREIDADLFPYLVIAGLRARGYTVTNVAFSRHYAATGRVQVNERIFRFSILYGLGLMRPGIHVSRALDALSDDCGKEGRAGLIVANDPVITPSIAARSAPDGVSISTLFRADLVDLFTGRNVRDAARGFQLIDEVDAQPAIPRAHHEYVTAVEAKQPRSLVRKGRVIATHPERPQRVA